MKHLREIIIGIVFIIVILAIILVFVLTNKEKSNENSISNTTNSIQDVNNISNTTNTATKTTNNTTNTVIIKEVEDPMEDSRKEGFMEASEYLTVKSCVQSFVYATNLNDFTEETQKECLYNMLSTKYINDNKVDKNNVLLKVNLVQLRKKFIPLEIHRITDGNLRNYKVYGITERFDDNTGETAEYFYCIVNVSFKDGIFSIEPINENQYKDNGNKPSPTNITQNKNNRYVQPYVSTQTVVEDLMDSFVYLTIANPKFTYDRLSANDKNQKFGSYDSYSSYIKRKINQIKSIEIENYEANVLDNGTTRYTVKDQYENEYIFEVQDMLHYTITLN